MTPTDQPATDAGEPESFEAAIERLEELVTQLEGGDVPLEKSLAAFEEGRKLIAYCEQKLQVAEQVLKQLAAEAETSLGKDVLHGGQ
jgi:exodeoxyribonuclease VII small subunit